MAITIRVYPATPAAAQALAKIGARRSNGEYILVDENIAAIVNEYVKSIQSSLPPRISSMADIARLYATLSKLGQPAIRLDIVGNNGVFYAGFYSNGFGVIVEYPVSVAPGGIAVQTTPRAATLVILTPEGVRRLTSMVKR